RWPARAIARHVCPRGCVRSPRARILQLESTGPCLPAHLSELVRWCFFPACVASCIRFQSGVNHMKCMKRADQTSAPSPAPMTSEIADLVAEQRERDATAVGLAAGERFSHV